MRHRWTTTAREVDPLSLIFINIDFPVVTPGLHWAETALEFSNDKTLLAICRIEGKSQSYTATDGQSVSKSCCRAPSGTHDQIFITVWQLRSCFGGTHFLTRWLVCLLYMLLALACAVFLGSESLSTHYHTVLSQIWDFPSLPPTTRRVAVGVFDPASARIGRIQSQRHIATDDQSVG
jgi:hypothetical protein